MATITAGTSAGIGVSSQPSAEVPNEPVHSDGTWERLLNSTPRNGACRPRLNPVSVSEDDEVKRSR